jgi:hypothetical protein
MDFCVCLPHRGGGPTGGFASFNGGGGVPGPTIVPRTIVPLSSALSESDQMASKGEGGARGGGGGGLRPGTVRPPEGGVTGVGPGGRVGGVGGMRCEDELECILHELRQMKAFAYSDHTSSVKFHGTTEFILSR